MSHFHLGPFHCSSNADFITSLLTLGPNSKQLSENFIFIYLGLSLFTQAELVYKPLFIIVTVVAVVVSRYCAVFPIANAVNFVRRHKRASRNSPLPSLREDRGGTKDELPREYQIMLFWAGLRGAVGFALSAGIEGEHAVALQTTVLVTVVLTVIIFGGTTAQMLEILGIRMGVTDDEDADSDDEDLADDGTASNLRLASVSGPSVRRRRSKSGNGTRHSESYRDDEGDQLLSHARTSTSPDSSNGSGGERPYPPSLPRDRSSAEEDEDDPEVLPGRDASVLRSSHRWHASARPSSTSAILESSTDQLANSDSWMPSGESGPSALDLTEARSGGATARQLIDRAGLIFRDGQWFQKIDERYLLPMFGNSVAQRKADDDKARRVAHAQEQEGAEGPSVSTPSSRQASWGRATAQWSSDPGPLSAEPDAQDGEPDEEEDGTHGQLRTLRST